MSILSDKEIIQLCEKDVPLIKPFELKLILLIG
jgi:hypothetical protein